MSFFNTQNPGIGGLDEITDAETVFLQSLAALSYADGDILYYQGGQMRRLAKGSNGQVLTLAAGLPSWSAGAGISDGDKGDITVSASGATWTLDIVTTYTRTLLDDVDAATARATLGLGTLATQSGTFSGSHSGTSSGTNTGDQTNITGNAATVTTNANMTGAITSVGNTTSLGSFTLAQLNTAVSDANIARTDAANAFIGTQTIDGARALTTTPLVVSATSYTTDTGSSLNMDNLDVFVITAQAGALLFNAPGGTLVQGRKLIIRIKDNGTARALTWNAVFRAIGTALPSTTVLSKTLYLGFMYNSTDTKWDLIASAQEA